MSADHPEDTNHGDSVAAWTSVIVIIVASIVATYAWVVADSQLLVVAGIATVVGIALGPILKAFGLGQKK
jgi:divalent metal cation (Fe/Co/Zn/Cd) transporter